MTHINTSPSQYRPDIDGLRAISVLAIVFSHLKFSGFQGGFVGVDIFFVISGYLITQNILREQREGVFSFARFYARRARRLLPALLFTLLLTWVASIFILSPQHLERASGALLSAIFFSSNFFFIGEAGYFGTPAQFRPLLHTWSLGIEEQFYILWPITLIFILRRRNPLISRVLIFFLAIGVLLSITLATLFAESESAYYFTPFRIFEFFIGIGIAVLPNRRWHSHAMVREAMALTGLLFIGVSITQFSHTTPFPSYYTLLPTVGAALIIKSNNPAVAGWALRHPASVWIGLISYSLYLVHWPIIILANYEVQQSSVFWDAGLLTASVLAAAFMYYRVETPARRLTASISYRRFWPVVCSTMLLLVVASAHTWHTGGMAWRFPVIEERFDPNLRARVDSYLAASKARDDANYVANNVLAGLKLSVFAELDYANYEANSTLLTEQSGNGGGGG